MQTKKRDSSKVPLPTFPEDCSFSVFSKYFCLFLCVCLSWSDHLCSSVNPLIGANQTVPRLCLDS